MIGDDSSSYWWLAVLATALLTALKLSGGLSWPWLIVTVPVWFPLAVSVSLRLAALALVLAGIYLVSGGSLQDLRPLIEQLPMP